MLFPMYTVAADVLLKMTTVEPHEKLKAGSHIVEKGCVIEASLQTLNPKPEALNPKPCLIP